MLQITKIIRFEMAHAIAGYEGACKDIHGHSYELHVTVSNTNIQADKYIPAPGFILDFKELKKHIQTTVTDELDHKLILSAGFLKNNTDRTNSFLKNLLVWEVEPTAENLLVFIRLRLNEVLPDNIRLTRLRLYETKDSYSEWLCSPV